MKITQSWKRNTPTTDGYSLTVTYVYSSKYFHEIEDVEKKLPKGIIIMETPEITSHIIATTADRR